MNAMIANEILVLALPKGRILKEVMPLVRRAGIEPEPAFDDPESRQLKFATNVPGLEIIRVRSFDVATFVAFGAAHFNQAVLFGMQRDPPVKTVAAEINQIATAITVGLNGVEGLGGVIFRV